jgi:hypothetical protein
MIFVWLLIGNEAYNTKWRVAAKILRPSKPNSKSDNIYSSINQLALAVFIGILFFIHRNC